ncbi:MAG: phosphatidylserine synthase [Akkermansiaceae bacterium]|nr:phosphatidylserine synthase [Akkermansiaceae bacterium]
MTRSICPVVSADGVEFVSDAAHGERVLQAAAQARRSLWLGTADIKDLYVAGAGGARRPFLGVLAGLLERGVEVRLIHAKEPGALFRQDFDRFPGLAVGLERVLCPRVHFKLVVVDSEWCYIGSANLTGAGMGMKSSARRNFEAGVVSCLPALVAGAMEEFDRVWRGDACAGCGRREFCPDPVVTR